MSVQFEDQVDKFWGRKISCSGKNAEKPSAAVQQRGVLRGLQACDARAIRPRVLNTQAIVCDPSLIELENPSFSTSFQIVSYLRKMQYKVFDKVVFYCVMILLFICFKNDRFLIESVVLLNPCFLFLTMICHLPVGSHQNTR